MDKLSYSLGLSIASNLQKSGITNLNDVDFSKGVADFMSNKAEFNIDEANKIINAHFEKIQAEQAKERIENEKEFFNENKKNEGVVALESGLQYQILTEGKGDKPSTNDNVKCHYHGTLIDGSVFDSSVQRGEPAVFPVNGVIAGWVEALQLMSVGSKWRLFVPSELAYGAQGAGQQIPPYTSLIFEVELLEIVK